MRRGKLFRGERRKEREVREKRKTVQRREKEGGRGKGEEENCSQEREGRRER